MSEGYQIVEPSCLTAIFSDPKCFDFAVIILSWVASEANSRRLVGDGKVEVIRVEYAGAYPALGVRGTARDDADAVLQELSATLLRTKSVEELISFAAASGIHWRNQALAILGP